LYVEKHQPGGARSRAGGLEPVTEMGPSGAVTSASCTLAQTSLGPSPHLAEASSLTR